MFFCFYFFQEFYASKRRREPALQQYNALVFSQPSEGIIPEQQHADEDNQLPVVAASAVEDTDQLDSEDECYYSDGNCDDSLDILRTEQVRACASLNAFDLVDALGLDDDA